MRELVRRGLAAEGFLTAEAGMKSQEFGVLGAEWDKAENPDRSEA